MSHLEKAKLVADLVMRFLAALMLPAWGLAVFLLGVTYGFGWWVACGVAIAVIGLVILAGSPLTDSIFRGG